MTEGLDLFGEPVGSRRRKDKKTPLAERMRPRSLDEFVGQEHLVGQGAFLRTIL